MTNVTFPRREFLQLAETFDPEKHSIAGWYVSEKLDGMRTLWDGGISRRLPVDQVPYAGLLDPKTGQPKVKLKSHATGLWSRYGNPIMAPDWFLDRLPPVPLDGELWAGRGNFQLAMSICRKDEPDQRFDQLDYAIYGMPSFDVLFQTGEIKNANFHASFDWEKIRQFVISRCTALGFRLPLFHALDLLSKNCWKFANGFAISIASTCTSRSSYRRMRWPHANAWKAISPRPRRTEPRD